MGAEMYLVSLPQAVNNALCVVDSNHHFVKPEKKTLTSAVREFLFSDYVFSKFYLVKNSCNFALSWSLSLPDFSLIRVSLVVESQSLISGCSRFLANP